MASRPRKPTSSDVIRLHQLAYENIREPIWLFDRFLMQCINVLGCPPEHQPSFELSGAVLWQESSQDSPAQPVSKLSRDLV